MSRRRLNANRIFRATITSLAAIGFCCDASADEVPNQPRSWEKCFGVVKKGRNDCSSLDGRHGCGGKAKMDADPTEYIWMPKGTCSRIVNGNPLEQFAAHKVKVRCPKKK